MARYFNNKTYIVAIVLFLCVGLALFTRSCLKTKEIACMVSPLNVELGQPVAFADSTRGATRWLWEFGDGESSSLQNGEYTYTQAGKYQIRLTVNNELTKKFIVTVQASKREDDIRLIKIEAPETALQGEYVIFRGEGSSNKWRWEFGETGMVDAKEKTAVYRYDEPGIYQVLLSTEETKYPIRHRIEITAQYTDNDSINIETVIGNEIRLRLQAIADSKAFNTNYNYVKDTYLCNNPNTQVIVNHSKYNDFYSYCQGLRILGRNRTVIDNVLVELHPDNENCVRKIVVLQTDIN